MAFHLLPQIEPTPSGTKADGRAATMHWEYQGSPGSSCVVGTGAALARRPQMHIFLPRSSIIFSRLNAFQFVVYLWLISSALAWFILANWSSFLLFFLVKRGCLHPHPSSLEVPLASCILRVCHQAHAHLQLCLPKELTLLSARDVLLCLWTLPVSESILPDVNVATPALLSSLFS